MTADSSSEINLLYCERHTWWTVPRARSIALALTSVLTGLLFLSTAASAASPPPRWELESLATPTPFEPSPGAADAYEFVPTNVGGPLSEGEITLNVQLPQGVTAFNQEHTNWVCPSNLDGDQEFSCTYFFSPSSQQPERPQRLEVQVHVTPGLTGKLSTEVEVAGGGAPAYSKTFTNEVGTPPTQFSLMDFEAHIFSRAGDQNVRAGSHPGQFWTGFTAASVKAQAVQGLIAVEEARDIVFDLPPGFVGNPDAANKCPIAVFQASYLNCPAGSYLGELLIGGGSAINEGDPIYNLVPEEGYPAELGFYEVSLVKSIVAQARLAHTGEGYVVRVQAAGLLRGVPQGPYFLATKLIGNPEQVAGLGTGTPFFTAPSDCSGTPLHTELHIDTWRNPAAVPLDATGALDFGAANFADPQWHNAVAESPPVSGCEALSFTPTIKLATDATTADSPTGLSVNLAVPQNEEPEGLATPPLRDATVALPEGLVVDPSVASGLAGCSVSQLAPDSTDPGSCPAASKLGTATLRTPLIDHPLEGSVYIGNPECAPCSGSDAASGRLLKLYIEIDDPATGTVVKLPGSVDADPVSGRLTASFTENPQLPFEDLELQLKSGSRAPLTTPATCGQYTTTSDLKPWSAPQSGPDAAPQARFPISSAPAGSSCAGLANATAFEAGTAAPVAGSYSPFLLKLSREDGSQRISSLEATLPEGLLGRLAGIPYCSEAAIAAATGRSGAAEQASPSCSPASEVGTVDVGAGSGTPFHVGGHAYLAGPYKGAPLSLAIITPALAGPFDLGTVVVRTALYVDQTTAQIHAVSDPIPQILAGVPLDIRSISLDLSRSQFTLNPTSCDPMQILGSATSGSGQVSSLQSRFQVGGCRGLAFSPKLALRLGGSTQRGKDPALRAVLTQPAGQANIRNLSVVLPKSEFIDQRHVDSPCTRVQFAAGPGNGADCPASSILGYATAYTPLLEQPLHGPVYFRSNGGERQLPDLVASLEGQVHLNVVGFVDSAGKKGSNVSRIRNTFATVPDAPVTKFVLSLKGGKKGLLQNSANLCKVKNVAKVMATGQNGAIHDFGKPIAVGCGGKQGRSKKKPHRHR